MDKDSREQRTYIVFIISITLTVLLVMSGVFLGMAIRTRKLISEENISRGQALFNGIVLTRKWNAGYGGVYVEKKEGVVSNPYLVNPDITAENGTIYTKRNPALMTREISDIAKKEGAFSFNITSLRPLNPGNVADDYERQALQSFEKGTKEVYGLYQMENQTVFRYMAPLHVEQTCLQCHAVQGYKIGDIRGGISILFNVEQAQQKLRSNTVLIIIAGVITAMLMLSLFYFFTLQLIKKIKTARRQLEQIAKTDMLTALLNRRHIMERFDQEFERSRRTKRPLSCIMIDVDHFKTINDTHGHLAGDAVLKEISRRLQSETRKYDAVGRYGGEEFLVMLPETGLEQAQVVAERIRMAVRDTAIEGLSVTISLGVALQQDNDNTTDDLLRRADGALYSAKGNGRDRIHAADK